MRNTFLIKTFAKFLGEMGKNREEKERKEERKIFVLGA